MDHPFQWEEQMTQKTKQIKKICECKHCGNEAEMLITCTLADLGADTEIVPSETKSQGHEHQVKGSATCSHCGNEADMWVDLD